MPIDELKASDVWYNVIPNSPASTAATPIYLERIRFNQTLIYNKINELIKKLNELEDEIKRYKKTQ